MSEQCNVICSIAMQDSVVPFEVIICGLVVLLTLLAIFFFVQLLGMLLQVFHGPTMAAQYVAAFLLPEATM